VYEAYDPLLDRTVAIKLVPESPSSRRDLVQRSPDLAPLLRELRHPNLVSVYDVGTVGDELVYIIMDRLIGRTLRSVLLEQHTLTPLELLPIGIQVAEGMARAHLQHVIHRDLRRILQSLREDGTRATLGEWLTYAFGLPDENLRKIYPTTKHSIHVIRILRPFDLADRGLKTVRDAAFSPSDRNKTWPTGAK
jgi:serine/threonine protein kinase